MISGVLLSWAVTKGPSYRTGDKRLAVRTEDHPLEYGDFEGTIPKGNYGGGTVMLWDTGHWRPVGDPEAGLKKGKLAFILEGERLHGHWALVRMRPRPKEKRENWLLLKEKDEYANPEEDLLDDNQTSVVSGRKMKDIARGADIWESSRKTAALPEFTEPALATLVEAPPQGKNWAFEIKYDGYRAMIAADGKAVRIYTRSGLDWTEKFAGIAEAVAKLNLRGALLDSEIVVVDKAGRTDFGALVTALEDQKTPLSCFVFDLLAEAGEDWRGKPLGDRQARLQELLGKPARNAPVQLSEVFTGDGAKLLATACAHQLEGILAKRVDRPYRAGRHQEWLKIKCGHAQEFIVIGFAASDKHRPFASLAMAVREGDTLRYAGRVGSGYSEETLAQLAAWRDAHLAKTPPCEVPAPRRRGVTWVTPELVAQVEFGGWTPDGHIRHGRFQGLREDKPAEQVVPEMPNPSKPPKPDLSGHRLTHPDRVLYPEAGITKAEVAEYLAAAAPHMFPYMKDRFISFVRTPDGIEGQKFFQRHLSAGFGPDWIGAEDTNPRGKSETYVYAAKPGALLDAAQMGVLEFHLWGSRRDAVEQPDRIVFDLDPDPSVEFSAVKEAALRLRAVLDALGLQSLPLLTGGKGVHVVVPIQRQPEWPAVKAFAAALSARIAADAPEKFTDTMSRAKRTGKIFIDHFRNERGSTAIAPYSPRARANAAVAWPVSWAGLEHVGAADAMTIPKALAAIGAGENGWAGYGAIKQRLTKAAIDAVG
jgi:bifunctional non-homologous end joining protein LigD